MTAKTVITLVQFRPNVSVVLGAKGNSIGEVASLLSRAGRLDLLAHPGMVHPFQIINLSFPNAMSKRKKPKKQDLDTNLLSQINPNAAGIDIGADRHWVSIPVGRDEENIRSFTCFTPDLYVMADWLKQCKVETVAMESTGVYWIPVFQVLESRGFDVKLVNAHYVKTVPGRKTDVLDCQWLQQLHTYGLLSGSFRPEDQICKLRSYIRQRDNLIKSACIHIQRMQKALTQMNIQLHRDRQRHYGYYWLKYYSSNCVWRT